MLAKSSVILLAVGGMLVVWGPSPTGSALGLLTLLVASSTVVAIAIRSREPEAIVLCTPLILLSPSGIVAVSVTKGAQHFSQVAISASFCAGAVAVLLCAIALRFLADRQRHGEKATLIATACKAIFPLLLTVFVSTTLLLWPDSTPQWAWTVGALLFAGSLLWFLRLVASTFGLKNPHPASALR